MIIAHHLKRFFLINYFYIRFNKTKKLAKIFKNPEDTSIIIR